MTSAPGDTWAGIILDGLVGALIGSVATIIVVVATIRNDAKARRLDRLEEAVATAHTSAGLAGMTLFTSSQGLADPQALTAFKSMIHELGIALARAQRPEPGLAEFLQGAADDLTATMAKRDGDPSTVAALAIRVQVALGRWIADPDPIRYGVMTYEHVPKIVELAGPNTQIDLSNHLGITAPGLRTRLAWRWKHRRRPRVARRR